MSSLLAEALALVNHEEVERERIKNEIIAQPIFSPNGGSSGGNGTKTHIINSGSKVHDVKFSAEGPDVDGVKLPHRQIWDTDQVIDMEIGDKARIPFKFTISFLDGNGVRREQNFDYFAQHNFRKIV